MLKKIFIVVGVVLLGFVVYVGSRPNTFHYERSGVIYADIEKIYPYLNNFKLGSEWSPYEKIDTNMKKIYSGPEAGVGAKMQFAGNREVGEGVLEIISEIPNESVEIRLEMIKPFHGINMIHYGLASDMEGTRFTWTMHGQANFFTKLVGVFIDCEKMIGDQFSQGILNLKNLVESKSSGG